MIGGLRSLSAVSAALMSVGSAVTASAQGFPLKATMAAAAVTGCGASAAPAITASTPLADEEARALISEGREASLQGELGAARDAYVKAATLAPLNAQLAYDLGRVHEALNEPAPAVREYCRYMALAPNAPEGDEVRGRIVRLTPADELRRIEEARAQFQSGVALLQRRQYAAADSVFATVAQQVPSAPEPFFNRALSRAARGDRQPAMRDFERYLELAPQSQDRAAVRDAMARLPDRVYGPGQAFASGLAFPGLGQMSTGRPVLGVLVLGIAGGGGFLALQTQEKIIARTYTDPFGNRYTDSIPETTRPRLIVGLASAGVVWLGSALESIAYARRSRARAEAIISTAAPSARSERQVSLHVRALPAGRMGIGVSW
jgi:tetratricopeptide (TPR) repeat protein